MTRMVASNDKMRAILSETRKAHGLSQVALAERAGLHERAIYRCEAGRTAITMHTLVRCDKVLGGELIKKIIKESR